MILPTTMPKEETNKEFRLKYFLSRGVSLISDIFIFDYYLFTAEIFHFS